MHNEISQNNDVFVIGSIVSGLTFSHEVFGEKFYVFEIEVLRLSDKSDVLPVTISERLLGDDELVEGVKIKVEGQIRSYNNFIETENRNKLVLTIFAREYEIVSKEVEDNPNEIFLNGYVCKPPIYRVTPFGREIVDILLAVNRSYNKSDYIPCIAWGRNARFASKICVGDNIKINGRMQSRNYQKKSVDGECVEKTAYEVSVSKLEYDLDKQISVEKP